MKSFRMMRKAAAVALGVLVATTALATPSTAATQKLVDSTTVGTYTSGQACTLTGDARVSNSAHWTHYSCKTIPGSTLYQLTLQRYIKVRGEQPAPAPVKVQTDSTFVGTYVSVQECGRTASAKLAGQTYWTTYSCSGFGSTWYLRLERYAEPGDTTQRPVTSTSRSGLSRVA